MALDSNRWTIDDVLARTDLAGLLDEVARAAGSSARGRRWHCPILEHTDANASVTMFTDARGHERWRCWSGDDHRGDAIDLITASRRTTRAEAINELAQRAGLRVGEPPPPMPERTKAAPTPPGPRPLDPAVVRYAQACEQILWSKTGRPVRDWLEQRRLHEDIIRADHVGADPGRTMLRRQRGLPYGATIAATFPVLDPNGNIRYLQTRYLESGGDGPKYDNPAGYLGSNPRVAWTVSLGTEPADVLVVCEGIPDALTAAQAGHPSVGVLGSRYPDASVGHGIAAHAERFHLPVFAVIDADDAGRQWGRRLAEHVVAAGGLVNLVEPPGTGLDLNDWARRDPTWSSVVIGAARMLDPPRRPGVPAIDARGVGA